MADSFTLPLRPLTEGRDAQDTLPVEIAQINSQWGSFRDVTEEKLRAMIQAGKGDSTSEAEESDRLAGDVDRAERLEELYKRRGEITQFALQAHMETMFALDFVSLLLSKHAPRQAETSLSDFLKQVAPLGSLNAEVVKPSPKQEAAVIDTKKVSRGWRLQSFNAAANKLLNSAARLEEEVALETKYWGEVLAVKDKGWKVCRMPRERQTLGVQYGFLEATPVFRDRGLASLRRGAGGCLVLDKGLVPPRPRAIRVRIKDRGQITGSSTLRKPNSNADDSIEGRILQARDTLYEEELFHELTREARLLAGRGITTRPDSIQVSAADEQEVLVDLVDVDQDPPAEESEVLSHQHDRLADSIFHAIHILLAFAHRQSLHRRTQMPPPLSARRRPVPEYQLLRPVMAYLQHASHVKWLESFLQDIYGVLRISRIDCEYTSAPFSSINPNRKSRPAPTVEALAEEFLRPLESTFSGTLAIPRNSVNVNVRTNLFPPFFGTHYDIEINLPQYPQVQPPSRIGLRDEAAAVIKHIIVLDMVSAISSYRPQPTISATQDEAKKETIKFFAWEPASPHHGELFASSSSKRENKKLKIELSREELTVYTYFRGAGGHDRATAGTGPLMHSYSWKRDSSNTEQPSMMEFVAEESKR